MAYNVLVMRYCAKLGMQLHTAHSLSASCMQTKIKRDEDMREGRQKRKSKKLCRKRQTDRWTERELRQTAELL
jgi:hypothetical protein